MHECAADRGRNLKVRQMERRVKDVERSIAKLVVRQLHFLERILFVNHDDGAGMRSSAERIVNQTRFNHLFGGQQVADFTHVAAGWTVHTATSHLETRS